MPAQPGQQKKKGGKGCPKLKRSGRHKHKYADQFRRTYRNKLRRVRKCNGPDAAAKYMEKFGGVIIRTLPKAA